MPPLKVSLRPEEREALQKLAVSERRNPPAQAAELIADALAQRGLLPSSAQKADGGRNSTDGRSN